MSETVNLLNQLKRQLNLNREELEDYSYDEEQNHSSLSRLSQQQQLVDFEQEKMYLKKLVNRLQDENEILRLELNKQTSLNKKLEKNFQEKETNLFGQIKDLKNGLKNMEEVTQIKIIEIDKYYRTQIEEIEFEYEERIAQYEVQMTRLYENLDQQQFEFSQQLEDLSKECEEKIKEIDFEKNELLQALQHSQRNVKILKAKKKQMEKECENKILELVLKLKETELKMEQGVREEEHLKNLESRKRVTKAFENLNLKV